MLRPIATDTHDFPSLRRDGKIYVDKTMFIHRLATDPNTKLFFISRPLFNANSLFGLSRNTIAAHFQRRLVDCATERIFEKTDLENVQSLQEKNHAVCNA